jgi:hypothetical protein
MKFKLILPIVFIFSLLFCYCDKPNYAPVLSAINAPDSLIRGDTLLYFIAITAIDPNGAGDIDSVYFVVTRPDTTSNNIHFPLNDMGQNGDSTAGDNRYSSGIQAPGPQSQLGNYVFTFYAKDKHGNKSNNPAAIITAYQRP